MILDVYYTKNSFVLKNQATGSRCPMNNRDRILSISADTRQGRIKKILAAITKNYEIQVAKPSNHGFRANVDIVNIVIPSKTQENKIIVLAHHDLYPKSAGLNDNSSGVSVLLRLQENLPDNVELVITDREEIGGLGCEYYIETCMHRGNIDFEAINLDVVGLGDKIFYEKYGEEPLKSFEIPSHLELYENIPFSDSRVLERYAISNVLLLTGKTQESLIPKISEAQHCNTGDGNMDLISEDTMDLVFNTVSNMIKSKKTAGIL